MKVPYHVDPPDPPPMPYLRGVREAWLSVAEARKALSRAEFARNSSQLGDALRSARFFINSAENACARNAGPKVTP